MAKIKIDPLLLQQPAMKPPPGTQSRIGKLPSSNPLPFTVFSISIVIILMLFCMRLFVKIRIQRQVALEDYLVIFAWLMYNGGYTAIEFLMSSKHIPVHQWDVTIGELISYLNNLMQGAIIYNVIVLPLKLSIILQILRIFVPAGVRNSTFWLAYSLIAMNIVYYIISTALLCYVCKPEKAIFDPEHKTGRCLSFIPIFIANAAWNSFSDALLIILPQRVIWSLHLPMKRKIGLSAAFLIAFFALGSSVAQLYFSIRLTTSADVSYHVGWLGIWTVMEITVGFTMACFPVLPKLFQFVTKTEFAVSFKTKFGSMFRMSSRGSRHLGAGDYPRTSRVLGRPRSAAIVTDIEFHDLVVNTTSETDMHTCHTEDASRSVEWTAKGQDL
ncbi:hypothetical protein K491DRAFT_775234 [Lophiostoma macrostomum CBS 122681]|uniref:Rhodopsin domain-containing protein n=1 Tax=Lophiostoma macrostomum CBS 122681 TaxID=1314788 RepID=A0A6A6TIB0_9PLEO|nr:hypothetical protein K491DRAFT_775234 [Lophiostoma macrostomum CBS 122681]